jgi:WD40 repeat protein
VLWLKNRRGLRRADVSPQNLPPRLTKYPQRSLLLAVEAAKLGQTLHRKGAAGGEQPLREALAHVGGRALGAAAGQITAVAISPDNRWVVTGSADEMALLWDLINPEEALRKSFGAPVSTRRAIPKIGIWAAAAHAYAVDGRAEARILVLRSGN